MNAVQSKNYKTRVAVMDGRTCLQCKKLNGKIYYMHETPYPQPPIHVKAEKEIHSV